ncbi:hypothetical protein FRB93_013819 [Tulasnella sp. JGI-2019a]|nr:hypothetical protein FRB93_013819 [Tulasnella sp. JGI-2019a]
MIALKYTQLRESGDFATFRNNATFLSTIDSLPDTSAPWNLTEITVEGNLVGADGKPMTETLELWMRDPVQCVADLIGNPAFRDVIAYAPVQETEVEEDGNGEDINEEADRFFDEMWSADWWWGAQAALPENATVAPIILASDKTQLSTFSGDKQAWPVYLSIGNINKATCRRPSERATVLLGYLPVSKLLCFHPKDRSNQGHRLFHYAMRQLLAPLISAGKTGAMMTCADGFVRHVFPLLAAYIADHPEQCLVTCCRENRCPKCRVAPGDRGNLVASLHRVQVSALDGIRMCDTNPDPYEADGLRDVPEPFWADLPLVDIFRCITPDMLHQLHKGTLY